MMHEHPSQSVATLILRNLKLDAKPRPFQHDLRGCLLYTSDAADERSSVDLGGRRIIKKKKREKIVDYT